MTSVLELPPAHPVLAARSVEPLRVLVVTESFLPQINGVTNSVRRVLEHLAAEGHVAELVAPTGPADYMGFPVTIARGARLPFYQDFRLGLETRRRLRSIMLRFEPDVVHIASPATLGLQAIRVAGELGLPTVAIYQTDLMGFAATYSFLAAPGTMAAAALTRKIHNGVDRTLAPSTASIDQLSTLGVANTALWPRGVNLEQFDPRRRDHGLRARLAPNGETILGYVGRLAAEKELHLLADLDKDPRIKLVLVGDGPDAAKLRKQMPNAEFLGLLHGDELGAAYASLDIFVHTGRHETFCQAAQEALASGVPVVAPRSGGPMDIVDDTVTGLFYRPGDAEDLAEKVYQLVDDPRRTRKMGRDARTAVTGRSWHAINERLVGHYRQVIADRALTA